MNGEIMQDYCEKCMSFVDKKVNVVKNTLTCLTCSTQEDFMITEAKMESEIINSIQNI